MKLGRCEISINAKHERNKVMHVKQFLAFYTILFRKKMKLGRLETLGYFKTGQCEIECFVCFW